MRFPRGTLPEWPPEVASEVTGGGQGARWLKRARTPRVTFITLGPLAVSALEAAAEEPDWSVVDARFVTPLDEAAVLEAAACGRVVVAEEGTVHGGLGSAVLEVLAARRVSARVVCVGMPEGKAQGLMGAFPTAMVGGMKSLVGSAVGNRAEAKEVLEMAARGVVKVSYRTEPMEKLQDVFEEMKEGRLQGRVVLDLSK